ncbi:hypothetical protein [Xanthomonas phage OP2]|uniref:Uncharacterized protein n=1 Tax=Xanthomonas phage OP2 TaxID=331627 RepID=Q2NP72_9CAUD|nr:hypothetical protein OP2_ORF60 [Xanthomonas phage OP2]BAE72824.1 hypothetical protein [Xanthomonas phage OP2]
MKIIIDSITELLELTALIQRGVSAPNAPAPSRPVEVSPDPVEDVLPIVAELPDIVPPDALADVPEAPEAPEATEPTPRKRGRRKSTPVETESSPIIVETHSLPTDEDITDGDDSQTTETDSADAVSDGADADSADTGGDATEPTGGDDAPSAEQPSSDQGTATTASPSTQAPVASVGGIDLVAYVESKREASLDASDSHMDVITAGRDFITAHGHDAYNALKEVVAPLEGVQHGKALPQFTPAERRLFLACMKNYSAS